MADSVCHRIADARVIYGSEEVRVTVSVGVTVTRPGEIDTQNLLLRVDAALYRAKNEGRNCVRAVIGDLRGVPVARPPSGPILPFPDRRDPSRSDRRRDRRVRPPAVGSQPDERMREDAETREVAQTNQTPRTQRTRKVSWKQDRPGPTCGRA